MQKNAEFQPWRKGFTFAFPVNAGEELKNIHRFPEFIEKLLKKTSGASALRIVAVGGGSVGDFAGFVASILKRGVPLIHIPSTWLAAIDSSHGGKTALNVPPFKNQIGSFYPAEKVFLVESLLRAQPKKLAKQAYYEMVKMALIAGGDFWKDLAASKQKNFDLKLWKFLLRAVDAKNKVVKKDPFEKKGIRQVLNLGHTVGHVFESFYGLNHGESVGLGLHFSLQWSEQKKMISTKQAETIAVVFAEHLAIVKPMPQKKFLQILAQDKKISSKGTVRFVFIKKPGNTPIQTVNLTDVVRFGLDAGWLK